MRIDSFFFSCCLLLVALLTLLMSDSVLIGNIACVMALVAMALFTVDDWFDACFLRVANWYWHRTAHQPEAEPPTVRNHSAPRFWRERLSPPLKARRRWLLTHALHEKRRFLHCPAAH